MLTLYNPSWHLTGAKRFSLMSHWFYSMIGFGRAAQIQEGNKMWFELILAAALVVLYVAFWAWHSQGAGKLTQAEIDRYLAIIEKLPLPEK
ncbi:MAG TPA: hypothetical protein VE176_09295, partial [Candidatus Limnocylindrales bacterium]|nr:hypothetical protein [Candidatus Limnocylindrales bacterium]